MKQTETIAAIATALSDSGIGIIRISGSEAIPVGDRVYRSKNGCHSLKDYGSHTIHYGFIVDGSMVKEITAEELAKACRKCAVLTVTDTGVLARALDLLGLEYDILSESTANVYGEIPISELTLELAKDQCRILSLHEKDETLESYYINLTGGGRYE